MSVLVAESEGVLQVVTASSAIGAEARARLAVAVAQITGDLGLTVSQLSHNGVAFGSSRRTTDRGRAS